MPQEWRQINGRWQLTGGQSADDLEAFIPADQPQQATGKPAAKPKPKPKPKPQGFMQQLVNDVTYELRQLRQDPARSAQRLAGNAVPLLIRAATGQSANNPNLIAPMGAGVGDNALRMAYSLFQQHVQHKPEADPSAGGFGRLLDANADFIYWLLGAKPPSEQVGAERDADMLLRSVGLNVGLGFIPGAGLGAAASTTRLGGAVRGAGALGLNEILSNFLDDNTGGNIINLANDLGGLKLPGAVNVGQDDMVTAAKKSILPNAVPGVALGAVGGFVNLIRRKRAGRLVEEARNAKARLERAGVQEQAEDGTAQFTPEVMDPGNAPTFADANRMREQQLGMTTDAPAAAPPPPPPAALAPEEQIARNNEEIQKLQEELGEQQVAEPAPDAPEADGLLRMADELDDQELQAVAAAPGPVVENVNQTLQSRPEFTPNPAVRLDTVAAPTDRLSQLYLDGAGGMEPWAKEIEAIPVDQLRSLVFPGNDPDLAARIMARTGKQFNELTRDDILELVRSLNLDGQTVLPNRMAPGQSVVRTAEIDAEPATFQFKQGVNEAGEQAGNSLDGVDLWDPNSEGVIQVWRSPVDGRMKVVNGHNRLALAKRLGIPSLRVEELVATTPDAARAKGAISNISAGSGTPFDAAKFLRETGITDQAGLARAGIPLDSGMGKQGLALSRLPDDLFQQAINEQIPLRKAVMIGESGLDPASMRSAWKMTLQQPGMTEGVLRETLAYNAARPASTAPTEAVGQTDLLRGTQWDLDSNPEMLARMELAAEVGRMLASDRKLFGTIGKQAGRLEAAGNKIDRAGAKEIGQQANRGKAAFDNLKYVSGPVNDLLNRGVDEVLMGAKPSAVAQQIKGELAQAIEATMAKEAAQQVEVPTAAAMPAEAPGQTGLFGDAPEAPARPLTADEREAMKIDIVKRAAAQGEIRPSATPEPQLPEPARVEIEEALADIEARGGIEPGTPGAQALADEVRLAREYDLQDAAMRQDQEDALRDAFGYETKTFEEKKELGMIDGWDPAQDSRGIGRNFHGSANKIELSKGGEFDGDGMNIYGDGFYATDDIQAAASYRKKNKKYVKDNFTPTIYEIIEEKPIKLYDLEAETPKEVMDELERLADRGGEWGELIGTALDQAETTQLADIMDEMRGWSRSVGVPAYEVQEMFQAIINFLEKQGYGGFTHTGGNKAGGGKRTHKVSIYWDPANSIELKEIELRDPATGKVMSARQGTGGRASAATAGFNDEIQELAETAEKLVKLIGGKNAKVQFKDVYEIGATPKEWGGDGKELSEIDGWYNYVKDVVQINGLLEGSPQDILETAAHEAFHRLQFLALTPQQLRILDSEAARLRIGTVADQLGFGDISYLEQQAVVFQKYAMAKLEGKDPIAEFFLLGVRPDEKGAKIIAKIISAYDAVANYVEKFKNFIRGDGFQSVRDIFDRAAKGEIGKEVGGPGNGLLLDMSGSDDFAQWGEQTATGAEAAASVRLAPRPTRPTPLRLAERAGDVEPPPRPAPRRVDNENRARIEANNQAMDDLRQKAMKEGC
jgi:hypothetical protein